MQKSNLVRQRFQSYFRILKLVWDAGPRYMSFAILLAILGSAVAPAQIWITKVILDNISTTLQLPPGTPLDGYALLTPVGILFLLWAIGGTCQTLSVEANMFVGIRFRNHAEFLTLNKAAHLDLAFYETPAFYDKMDNALRNVNQAHNLAYGSLHFLSSLLSLTAILALLIQFHPLAIFILLLTSAPQALIRGYFANQWWHIESNRAASRRMAVYLSGLLKSRDAAKEIRLFGLDTPFLERFRHFWEEYFNAEKRVRLSKERANALLGLASSAGTAGIWIWAIVRAVGKHITIGDVALVLQAAEQGQSRLSSFFKTIGRLYESTLFAENLLSFLDLSPNAVDGALQKPLTLPIALPKPIRHGIEFRNVSFHYPRTDRPVLKNLSFTLKPGETIAVAGENGAGKTTLVKLIARFYDPTEGEILLDGKDLRTYDPKDLRNQIGVIFQDFVRYDLSAKENIGFGQFEHLEDTTRITVAAHNGGADSLIEKLPGGLNTILGRTFDEGVDLSGGGWQKLALSRAFMREAQILILDEPTAALDAFAEYEIYARFAELTAGKMTIFISHRFSSIRAANHILVLRHGELIEEGTHTDLLNLNGQYAKMFRLQAERYQ